MTAPLRQELTLLQRSAARFFPEPEDQALAKVSDSQGMGGKEERNPFDGPAQEAPHDHRPAPQRPRDGHAHRDDGGHRPGRTFAELAGVARNWRLATGAVLANYVVVPAATVGLLLLFALHPVVAAGVPVLAVCPGAPYGPPFAAIPKGNVTVAVGLMVLLAGSSVILAPVLLHFLLPLTSGSDPLHVDAVKIVATLLATQLVPLGAGVALRQWRPTLADRLQRPANLASKVLNLATVGFILVTQFHLLTETRPRGLVGMLALLVASWAGGWLLSGSEPATRRTMTLTATLRNVGVGLVIATGAFAGTPAVTAVLVNGLFEVLGSLLLALGWARREAPTDHTSGDKEGVPVFG